MRLEHWLFSIPLRLRSLFRWAQADQELDDELHDHLERKTDEYVAQGMTQAEAHRRARLDLDGIEQTKEKCRDARRVNWIQDFVQDLRFGLRLLRKNPGFTTVAVLTLALGIGANTAIFSVVNGAFLRPLPVIDPQQLVVLACTVKGYSDPRNVSYPDFLDYRSQATHAFSDMTLYQIDSDALVFDNHAEKIITMYVTGNYFSMLGVQPAVGRLIAPNEGWTPGADPIVVLGYSYWQRRFNGDSGVIGKSVLLNKHPVTIIGVAARQFHGTWWFADVDAYLPESQRESPGAPYWTHRDLRGIGGDFVLGRLKPGVTLGQAQASLAVVAQRLAQQYPETNKDVTPEVFPERIARPQPSAASSIPLMVGVFLSLAIVVVLAAGINVVNLVLVRANTRQRELAIRSSLGASKLRLAEQFILESLLLALAAGALGLLLSAWVGKVLTAICAPVDLPWFRIDFSPDWRVFMYAFGTTLFIGVLVGLVSARRACRVDLNASLHEGGRGYSGGRHRQRALHALVIVQLAASVTVLIAAGLLVRSLENALHMDLGFDPRSLVRLNLEASQAGLDEVQGKRFYEELLERVRVLPGVEAATYSHAVPFGNTGFHSKNLRIEGHPLLPGQAAPMISYNIVEPRYFETLRMPILRGRSFTEADNESAPRVAVINESMAKRFWPAEDPMGKRFQMLGGPDESWIQVVGIAPNSQYADPSLQPQPYFYVPLAQRYDSVLILQVRSRLPTSTLVPELEEQIRALAPALPVSNVLTMEQQLNGANGFFLFHVGANLASGLGTIGLLLAVIGVYGVVSYAANQRIQEFGVRLVLGAQRRDIAKMVFGQGSRLTCLGLLAGMFAAAASGRLMASLLWGVSFIDPLTFISVAALLTLITLAAYYIPARRAMRADPMIALRCE
jgi:predicted permease